MRAVAILITLLIAATGLSDPGVPESPPLQWSEIAPLAPRSLLLDAVQTDGRIVVVGERGHVLLSQDGGSSWKQASVPTRSMLTAVAAVGEHIWAVGHDAVIVHSGDNGETWTRQHFSPEHAAPLLDVWFGDAQRGLAVGAYGAALLTRDGGATWKPVTVDTEEERHLNAIAAARDGTLYIAGESGVVFRSDDRGESWEEVATPYAGSLFGALALDESTILVFGLRAHIYRSSDRGETWTAVEVDSEATLLGGRLLSDGTVMIVGLSGAVLVSRNGGLEFRGQNLPDRRGIATAVPVDSSRILLVGEGGVHLAERSKLEVRS